MDIIFTSNTRRDIMYFPSQAILVPDHQVKLHPERYLVLDGSPVNPKTLPESLQNSHDSAKIPVQPYSSIPVLTSPENAVTRTGAIVSSGSSDKGLGSIGFAQYAFYKIEEDARKFNVMHQWITEDRTASGKHSFIGYFFHPEHKELTCTGVSIISRIGIVGNPACTVPVPKVFKIQGTHNQRTDPNHTWIDITDDITYPRSMWTFMTPVVLNWDASAMPAFRGIRMVISEWNYDSVSNKDILYPGLYRIKFSFKEDEGMIGVPKMDAPEGHKYVLDLQPYMSANENIKTVDAEGNELPPEAAKPMSLYDEEKVFAYVDEVVQKAKDAIETELKLSGADMIRIDKLIKETVSKHIKTKEGVDEAVQKALSAYTESIEERLNKCDEPYLTTVIKTVSGKDTYTHTVEKSPIQEIYVVGSDDTEKQTVSITLPKDPDEGDSIIIINYCGINKLTAITVHPETDHKLKFNPNMLNGTNDVKAGKRIMMNVYGRAARMVYVDSIWNLTIC